MLTTYDEVVPCGALMRSAQKGTLGAKFPTVPNFKWRVLGSQLLIQKRSVHIHTYANNVELCESWFSGHQPPFVQRGGTFQTNIALKKFRGETSIWNSPLLKCWHKFNSIISGPSAIGTIFFFRSGNPLCAGSSSTWLHDDVPRGQEVNSFRFSFHFSCISID